MKVRVALVVILLCCVDGCSGIPIKTKSGLHYLIIGIGVVSVPVDERADGAYVASTDMIGLQLSDQPGVKAALGIMTSSTIIVPQTTDNILIEVKKPSWRDLKVEENPN